MMDSSSNANVSESEIIDQLRHKLDDRTEQLVLAELSNIALEKSSKEAQIGRTKVQRHLDNTRDELIRVKNAYFEAGRDQMLAQTESAEVEKELNGKITELKEDRTRLRRKTAELKNDLEDMKSKFTCMTAATILLGIVAFAFFVALLAIINRH